MKKLKTFISILLFIIISIQSFSHIENSEKKDQAELELILKKKLIQDKKTNVEDLIKTGNILVADLESLLSEFESNKKEREQKFDQQLATAKTEKEKDEIWKEKMMTYSSFDKEIKEYNSKYKIDREFLRIAQNFANSRIRIAGNTDNTGNYNNNVRLSKKRAQSVVNYLVDEHGFDTNRFVVIGNGPDSPTATNSTSNGRAKNRRTDFELISQ